MQALRHWLKSDYQIVTIYTIKLSDNTNFLIPTIFIKPYLIWIELAMYNMVKS